MDRPPPFPSHPFNFRFSAPSPGYQHPQQPQPQPQAAAQARAQAACPTSMNCSPVSKRVPFEQFATPSMLRSQPQAQHPVSANNPWVQPQPDGCARTWDPSARPSTLAPPFTPVSSHPRSSLPRSSSQLTAPAVFPSGAPSYSVPFHTPSPAPAPARIPILSYSAVPSRYKPYPSRRRSMARRGGKRSSSPGDEDRTSNKVKVARVEDPTEFSNVVKNRLQAYTRTGQACDRCKVRKIRCDVDPDGCSHCRAAGNPCFVTDRTTGRTDQRGYLKSLECANSFQETHIDTLGKLLHQSGIEVMPLDKEAIGQGRTPSSPGVDAINSWLQAGSVWYRRIPSQPPSAPSLLSAPSAKNSYSPVLLRSRRALLQSRPGEAHIGVRGDDGAPLSSIKGTQLMILGMTIDFASFKAPDIDEPPPDSQPRMPLYNKSTQAFLQSTMGVNPPLQSALPERTEGFKFLDFYFSTINCFLPILHQPTFMRLVETMYDDPEFVPSAAELVQVHMVFAIMFFQYGVRNWQNDRQRNQCNETSNTHYHFALSKFHELTSDPDLSKVQAMALICVHTRSFPKPGSASVVVNHTFHRALELGLHRESRKKDEETNLNHEMRKRVWWTILTVYVAINGRRGLPMPIAVDEFDVGFPEPIPDQNLTETGVDTSRDGLCSYKVGIASFKIVPILMEMWSSIYCVRRDTASYVETINTLENQITAWADDLPEHLKVGGEADAVDRMRALFLRTFLLEFRLLLRHPSVAMTLNKEVVAENSRICEEAAKEMLQLTREIQGYRCLDTTWYQMSIYAAFIFTTLVIHWERRHGMPAEEFQRLQEDMQSWNSILDETSNLIGSGPDVGDRIKAIITHVISSIRDGRHETSENPGEPITIKQEPQPHPSEVLTLDAQTPRPTQPSISAHVPALNLAPNGTVPPPIAHKQYYQEPAISGQGSYSTLAYNDHTNQNLLQSSFNPQPSIFYNPQAAQAAAAAVNTVQGSSIAFGQQVTQQLTSQPPGNMFPASNGNAWQAWGTVMTDSQTLASALSAITPDAGSSTLEAADLPTNAMDDIQQWPMTLLDPADEE